MACRYWESLINVDWEERRREIEDIADWGRRRHRGGDYDCIVGVSGGKDSTRLAMYARDELGLKPLCVACQYPPEMLSEIGAANLSNLISLGFDVVTIGPAPLTWKELMRRAFLAHANYCKSTERALFASVARMSVSMNIPLAFLGENPVLLYGDVADMSGGEATDLRNMNTLSGGRNDEFLDEGITDRDLVCYNFPAQEELEEADVRIVFLGYYIPQFSNFDNAEFSQANGLVVRDVPLEDIGSIAPWVAMDDDFVHVNQMIKAVKFGNGSASDLICEGIQLGRITREEGIKLARKYDGRCAQRYISAFCKYIDLKEDEFYATIERFRDLDLWERSGNDWQLKKPPV